MNNSDEPPVETTVPNTDISTGDSNPSESETSEIRPVLTLEVTGTIK